MWIVDAKNEVKTFKDLNWFKKMIKKKYFKGSWIWQEIFALATYDMSHASDVPYLAHNSYIILLHTMVRIF